MPRSQERNWFSVFLLLFSVSSLARLGSLALCVLPLLLLAVAVAVLGLFGVLIKQFSVYLRYLMEFSLVCGESAVEKLCR